jgi:hypothetical protein
VTLPFQIHHFEIQKSECDDSQAQQARRVEVNVVSCGVKKSRLSLCVLQLSVPGASLLQAVQNEEARSEGVPENVERILQQ